MFNLIQIKQKLARYGRAKNTPTRSFVSNLYISQQAEAEISVTKFFITANMKNSKSRGKEEVDVR